MAEKVEVPPAEPENLLVSREEYLAAGVHIGTKIATRHMQKYIYRTTGHGLYVLDIRQTDDRLRLAAKSLARYDPTKILVTSVRRYGYRPVEQFAKCIGAKSITGRFVPGTLTNPRLINYQECDVLVITDMHADKQALSEAVIAKIPVIAFVDTDDTLINIDLMIPTNNRGRKALALVYWLLARQILRERGIIPPEGEMEQTIADFESNIRPSKTEQ
ncbi:MAG: 30S ribosomal protein S2 [Candidatus Sigynarchaeota archaeon]